MDDDHLLAQLPAAQKLHLPSSSFYANELGGFKLMQTLYNSALSLLCVHHESPLSKDCSVDQVVLQKATNSVM